MKLLYFAWLRETVGTGSEDIELPDGVEDVAGLIDWLRGRGDNYARALDASRTIKVAVNQTYAEPATALDDGDEVALFPPVTGG